MPPRERMSLDEVLALADNVAHYYAKRVAWASVNIDDVKQVTRMTGVEARAKFDERVAASEEAYLWRAMEQAARREIYRGRVGLSGILHRPGEATRGLRFPSFDAPHRDGAETGLEERNERLLGGRLDGAPRNALGASPEARAVTRQWRARVQARLLELAPADVVMSVLSEVAPASPGERLVHKELQSRVLRDPKLYDLLKELE